MNAYKNASFVGIVLAIIGIGICVYGFSFLMKKNDFGENGIKAKGKVVEIGENGPIYRYPIVDFVTKEGQKVRFRSEFEVNMDFFTYTIDQEVDVVYMKNEPSKARIDAFWEQNFGQLFLGLFGIFLMLFGFFFRRMMLRKAKAYDR